MIVRYLRALRILLIAAAVGFTLGAQPLSAWIASHPSWPGAAAAEAWRGTAERLGLTAPYTVLREAFRAVESWRKPD